MDNCAIVTADLVTIGGSPYAKTYRKVNRLGKALAGIDKDTDAARIEKIRSEIIDTVSYILLSNKRFYSTCGMWEMPALSGFLGLDGKQRLKDILIRSQIMLHGDMFPYNTIPLVSGTAVQEGLALTLDRFDPGRASFLTALLNNITYKQIDYNRTEYNILAHPKEELAKNRDVLEYEGAETDQWSEYEENLGEAVSRAISEDEPALERDADSDRSEEIIKMLSLSDLLYVGLLNMAASKATTRLIIDEEEAGLSTKRTELLDRWKSYYTFDLARILHTEVKPGVGGGAVRVFLDDKAKKTAFQSIWSHLRGRRLDEFARIIHNRVVYEITKEDGSGVLARLFVGSIRKHFSSGVFEPDQMYRFMVRFHKYTAPTFYRGFNPYKRLITSLILATSYRGAITPDVLKRMIHEASAQTEKTGA